MASREISALLPSVQVMAHTFLANCSRRNAEILIYCTLRDCWEQARLFRESHERAMVEAKVTQFHATGFGFLADVLVGVGPQRTGAWKTDAGPGESWHQYGEAFDAVPTIDGQCLWEMSDHPDLWRDVRAAGIGAGLVWGGDWPHQDNLHWQIRATRANPFHVWTPEEVKARLQAAGSLDRRMEE